MASSSQERKPSVVSVDLDPGLLGLPSPYHTDFPASASHAPQAVPPFPPTNPSTTSTPFLSFFHRFRYTKLPQTNDIEHTSQASDTGSSKTHSAEIERKPQQPHWSEYEETPADRWFTVLFLLLLLSALFNLFLLFNGPPNGIPRHAKPKDNPLPHKGFRFKEQGKNFTCSQTHAKTFEANFEYSNTYIAYDHLWHEMQGKSHGMIYTKINREDGQTRRAGLAMFHQLDCLAKIRSVVQALQNGEKDKEDVAEHHGYWPHCFDYLRQVILCNADDSIETSSVQEGRWITSGFGCTKECRDQKWLYEVTSCGEQGCQGKAFSHSEEHMTRFHKEEEEAVEKWNKEQKAKSSS